MTPPRTSGPATSAEGTTDETAQGSTAWRTWTPSQATAYARDVGVDPEKFIAAVAAAQSGDPAAIVRLSAMLCSEPEDAEADEWGAIDDPPVDETPRKPGENGVVSASAVSAVPWRAFPLRALPQPVRRYVQRSARALGCDPSYVALPLLAGLAAAIGNTYRVALKAGWTEPAIVWAVVVGESGTLKSPALELALRPVRARQHDAMRRHAESAKEHAVEMLNYERELATWKRSKATTDPPTEPAEPVAERTWVDDITVEALAWKLSLQPRGLLLARDELSAWLDFDRYNGKGGDVARWLEVFGGRTLVVDRRTGPSLYVQRAAVSIAGGIQPRILTRALGEQHKDNGLLARLLLACPPRRSKRWRDDDISPADEAALEGVFETLYSLEADEAPDGTERPHIVRLDPEARALWIEFYDSHAADQANLTGALAASASKLEAYAARLALVVHLARGCGAGALDAESMTAGISLTRWFRYEQERVYGILAEGVPEREQRRLVEWISDRGGAVTVRELARGLRRYQKSDDADMALDELVTAGLAVWVGVPAGPTGGRPTRACRLRDDTADTADADETPFRPRKSGVSSTVGDENAEREDEPDPPDREPGEDDDDPVPSAAAPVTEAEARRLEL